MTSAPVVIDGIPCFAPELLAQNDGFPANRFGRLADAERRNFWYRSRARIITRAVAARLGRGDEFLEIGCGTGSVLEAIAATCPLRLTGAEIYLDALRIARQRLPGAEFLQLDATRLPFSERFHGVGLFDVLEHIDDDQGVLGNVFRALRPGGHVFITVPQHRFLWSVNDEVAYHRRRYTRAELGQKLRQAGFEVELMTSFVTALFPAMVGLRSLKRRNRDGDPYEAVLEELELPSVLNAALEVLMRMDEAALAAGARLPFGGSLMAIATRPAQGSVSG